MAQGKTGYVDFAASSFYGTQTLRVYWSETYSGSTSDVSITKVELKSSAYFGQSYYGNLLIKINGVTAVTLTENNNSVYLPGQNAFGEVLGAGGVSITGTVSGIAHNSDGSKSVAISIHTNSYAQVGPLFYSASPGSIVFTNGASVSIALTRLSVGTLSLTAGTGVTASVTRSGTALSNGAALYYGDALTVAWTLASGYMLSSATLNGSAISSGATHTVTGNVTISISATYAVSSIATGNGTFGAAQTITVTRHNSGYTHTIVASCAGRTQTVATKSSSLSISWTPDPAIMAYITGAMSASCTLTCTTYSGDTALGSTSITVTLSLPTSGAYSVLPTPSLAVTDAMGYAATYGGYVQGQSRLAVTVTDGLKYGASAASRSTTAAGGTYTAPSFTTGVIGSSGAVSTTVRDSRGQTGTASTTVTVLPYTAPALVSVGVHRCDSTGTADDNGSYFYADYSVAITALNNLNSKSLTIRYRRTGGAWTSISVPLSAYTQSGTTAPVLIDTDYTYTVEFTLADDFLTISQTMQLSTTPAVMNFRAGGTGVAFGKAAEYDGTLEVAWNLALYGAQDLSGTVVEFYASSTGETVTTCWAKLTDIYDAMPDRSAKRVWVANNFGAMRGMTGGQKLVEIIRSNANYGLMICYGYWTGDPILTCVNNANAWTNFV